MSTAILTDLFICVYIICVYKCIILYIYIYIDPVLSSALEHGCLWIARYIQFGINNNNNILLIMFVSNMSIEI